MEEFPILVTKADALEYASRQLAKMVLDIKLAERIARINPADLPAPDRAKYAKVVAMAQHSELTMPAITEAAEAIKALALEERVVVARAQAAGVDINVTRTK